MALVDHLRELRSRVLVCILAMVPGTIVGWLAYDRITAFLTAPICDLGRAPGQAPGGCGPLVVTGLLGPLNLTVKVALATGVLLSAPVWLFQVWSFITPGLHRHERRWGIGFLATAVPLFFAGAALCYALLPKANAVLLSFTPDKLSNLVGYDEYLSLVLRLVLVFGLSFEVPVFLVLLNLAGLLPARRLASWWRIIVLAVFVFAAVATPTGDPFTMLALALPLLAMIGLAYVIAVLNDRRRARTSSEPDYDSLSDDEASPPPSR